jgi:hypothetical protein
MLGRTAHRRRAKQRIGKTTAGASPGDLLDYRRQNHGISYQ